MTIHAIIAGRGVYRGFSIAPDGDGYTYRDVIETGARAVSGRASSYAAAVRAVDEILKRKH